VSFCAAPEQAAVLGEALARQEQAAENTEAPPVRH
jgi:hypothetical protein